MAGGADKRSELAVSQPIEARITGRKKAIAYVTVVDAINIAPNRDAG
jgi:hypothetical protein